MRSENISPEQDAKLEPSHGLTALTPEQRALFMKPLRKAMMLLDKHPDTDVVLDTDGKPIEKHLSTAVTMEDGQASHLWIDIEPEWTDLPEVRPLAFLTTLEQVPDSKWLDGVSGNLLSQFQLRADGTVWKSRARVSGTPDLEGTRGQDKWSKLWDSEGFMHMSMSFEEVESLESLDQVVQAAIADLP